MKKLNTFFSILLTVSFTVSQIQAQQAPNNSNFRVQDKFQIIKLEDGRTRFSTIPQMFVFNSLYQRLGLPFSSNITSEDIRRAYENKIRIYNPDRFNDPALKEMARKARAPYAKAYNILSNSALRKAYDAKVLFQFKKQNSAREWERQHRMLPSSVGHETEQLVVGNLGFMSGMVAQSVLFATLSGDKAIEWAIWDSLQDPTMTPGLVGFSLFSEQGSMMMQKYLAAGPRTAGNVGMVLGSVANHFLSKVATSESWKNRNINWKEWGYLAEQRQSVRMEMSKLLKKRQELYAQNARADLKSDIDKQISTLIAQEESILGSLKAHRSAYFKNIIDTAYLAISPQEWRQLVVSSGRMLATVTILHIVREKILKEGGGKLKDKWGPEGWNWLKERKLFETIDAKVSELPEDQFPALIKFTKSVLGRDASGALKILPYQAVKKSILTVADASASLSKQLTGYLTEGTAPLFSRISVIFEGTALETIGGAAAKSAPKLVGWAGSLVLGAWGAIEFLSVDHWVGLVSTNLWNSARLESRLNGPRSAIEQILDSNLTINTREGAMVRAMALEEGLKQYHAVWEDFRQSVIRLPLNERYATWESLISAKEHEFKRRASFLAWISSGAKLDDPEFVRNGNPDENNPAKSPAWHTDPSNLATLQAETNEMAALVDGDTRPFKVTQYVERQQNLLRANQQYFQNELQHSMPQIVSGVFYYNTSPLYVDFLSKAMTVSKLSVDLTTPNGAMAFFNAWHFISDDQKNLIIKNVLTESSSPTFNLRSSILQELSELKSLCVQTFNPIVAASGSAALAAESVGLETLKTEILATCASETSLEEPFALFHLLRDSIGNRMSLLSNIEVTDDDLACSPSNAIAGQSATNPSCTLKPTRATIENLDSRTKTMLGILNVFYGQFTELEQKLTNMKAEETALLKWVQDISPSNEQFSLDMMNVDRANELIQTKHP